MCLLCCNSSTPGICAAIWANELNQMALDMRMNDIPIQPKRGTITDRNGHEPAFSMDVESLYAIPSQVKDPAPYR